MKNQSNISKPCGGVLMGLSTVSILQQHEFLNSNCQSYFMRRAANRLVFFKQTVKAPKRKQVTEKQLAALTATRFTGYISRDVQKKIVQTIQNWDDTVCEINARFRRERKSTQYQIVMLTLTLSKQQHHDDKYIKRWMLVPFIAKLLRENNEVNYLWKAEPQQNGNIHFHILLDRYFDKDWVRFEWNKTQQKHGYHPDFSMCENEFGMPSTRIESLRSKDNATAYAAKYISKQDGERGIEGRLWGCSDRLRELKPVEYSLSKDDVISIIPLVSDNGSHLWYNEYGVMINYPTNWDLIQDSLRLNFSADGILMHNVRVLSSSEMFTNCSILETSWFKEVSREIGEINALYLDANSSIFPVEWL